MDENKLKKQIFRITAVIITSSVILCVVMVSVLVYVIQAAHRTDYMQMKTEVQEYNNRVVKQIDKTFEILSSLSAVYGGIDSDDFPQVLEGTLAQTNEQNSFFSLSFFSLDGKGVVNTMEYGTMEITLDDCVHEARKAVTQAMQGEKTVSAMFDSAYCDSKIFVYSVPVYRDGKIIGVLAAEDTLEIFNDIVNGHTVMDGQGYIHVLDTDGNFLVRSENTLVKENVYSIFDGPYLSEATKAATREALQNQESMYGDFEYQGEKCHFYMEPIGLNGWYLFCANRMWGSSLSLGHMIIIMACIFLFVLILMLLLLYYGYYKFRKNTAVLLQLAYYDSVTGAKNTLRFDKDFRILCKNTCEFTVVAVNIHNFKGINDLFGKSRGDRVLVYVKKIIEESLNPGEFFCRDTADRFYILLLDTNKKAINKRIKKMISHISHTSLSYGEYRYELSLYAGIAIGEDREKALVALQSIQNSRYTNVAFYNQELHESVRKKNQIESQMNVALQNKQFKLFLQPKFDLKTNQLIGAEALVRWQNPDGSYRYPNEFIPLFETNGFCSELDMYMMERVCEQIREWIDAGIEPIPLSVNQSKLLFCERNYPQNIQKILDVYKIPSSLITLEVLESVASDDLEHLNLQIKALHDKGLRVSMDDFGSGYSSLIMLYQLEIDELKLDRGFLRKASQEDNKRRQMILEQIICFVKKLEISIVAEGIETAQDRENMLSLGCDYGQGFFYEKPMDAQAFNEKYMGK